MKFAVIFHIKYRLRVNIFYCFLFEIVKIIKNLVCNLTSAIFFKFLEDTLLVMSALGFKTRVGTLTCMLHHLRIMGSSDSLPSVTSGFEVSQYFRPIEYSISYLPFQAGVGDRQWVHIIFWVQDGQYKYRTLTFITGTDSPVNMDSSTMTGPLSKSKSHGTSLSSTDLPEIDESRS